MKALYIILLFFGYILTNSVCTDTQLVLELKQDLADNQKLDCLRVIRPRHGDKETTDQVNARLAAQWDTDCAFEAD
jgi:hypothetical protein